MLGLLQQAAGRTLVELAEADNHLSATPGVLAVLHTWGGSLVWHPHVHCVVTGGGLSSDKIRWRTNPRQGKFFLPVKALSRKFRGKFLAELNRLHDRGELRFLKEQSHLTHKARFRAWVRRLYATEWRVYAKRPFGGPERTLKYLARYAHGVAISDKRLLQLADDQVVYVAKDRGEATGQRVVKLDAVQFVERFAQHVLPRNFTRIRYFGIWGCRDRNARLQRCRQLIEAETSPAALDAAAESSGCDEAPQPQSQDDSRPLRCPACKLGVLATVVSCERRNRQTLLTSGWQKLTSWLSSSNATTRQHQDLLGLPPPFDSPSWHRPRIFD
jgi:hypothetical protein